ncbi:MAG TPA: hopanoid-associated sugar epimerase [Polyangia bacterium]|jgi:dihydroflavonol-4-reductase|nr:hopanoid-associated sugar epimerase [Polyangia bacterium]
MNAFLTGGSGFVGSHLARALVGRGARVRCLVRAASRTDDLRGLGCELVEGDLRDEASVRRGLAGADVAFHCAADYRLCAKEPDDIYRTNVDGTNNVMRAALELGVRRVVHTSSVATLAARTDGVPVDERARATLDDVVGDYKRSKLLAERAVEEWAGRGLPVVIVSPSTPVGEGDAKPTPTGQIIVDFLNGRMPAYVDTGLNLVDVRDVAEGHILAAERGRVGESYILGGANLSLKEILELCGRTVGRAAPRLRLPIWIPLVLAHLEAPLARALGREPRVPLDGVRMSKRKMFFDSGKAMRELGVTPGPIEPAIERAVRWFFAQGLVKDLAHRRPAGRGRPRRPENAW